MFSYLQKKKTIFVNPLRAGRFSSQIRHINYQKQWQIVKELEEEGNAIVLRPSADYGVTRYTHDKDLLGRWFDLGYEDTKNRLDMIREFMEK